MDEDDEPDVEGSEWIEDFGAVLSNFALTSLSAALEMIGTLRPIEQEIVKRRIGLDGRTASSLEDVASALSMPPDDVAAAEFQAFAKLRHPSRAASFFRATQPGSAIEIADAFEKVRSLTPDLIRHLQGHDEDLERIPPDVFEHLVGELLASAGFVDVRLVGKRADTSADVFACYDIPRVGIRVQIFVEVKRWREKVGVEVFNQVLGAMVGERDKFGWHSAMIGGAAETRKFSVDEWRLKGIEVRDKQDLTRWLEGYRPNAKGLWVPA